MSRNSKSKIIFDESDHSISKRPPLTEEAKENQMIALSMDLAEKQLRDGTASSQVITHFLKLGSSQQKLEQKVTEYQAELYKAKAETLKSAQHTEELYRDALKAMKKYQGGEEINEDQTEEY